MVRSTLQKRISSGLLLATIAVQLHVSGAFAVLQNTPAFRPFIGVQAAEAQSATRTFTSNDQLRTFVGNTAGGTVIDGITSIRNDAATAQKICQMAGYNTVSSRGCTDTDGRCNYTSCGDNFHQLWNGSSWSRVGACGGQWLAQLTCSDPVNTGGGTQCSNGVDDDGDGTIDALVTGVTGGSLGTAAGNFASEGADPKYNKTWIATITCRNNTSGQQTTFGNGDAQNMADLVSQGIANKGLPYTQPQQAIVRSTGGANWDDAGTFHTQTLTAVCQILGDTSWSYVSSTCRDNERSGLYPTGKCNFHTPGNNVMYRFNGTIAVPACQDGIDNDGDGLRDFPADAGCASANDASEVPHDPQCTDVNDNTESDAACSDGLDNDGDGLRDFPQDPGCVSTQDNDEFNASQCNDGIDNDNDGAADFPNDFSCSSPTDNDETNPKAACQDGADNDGDGLADFPQDPGCASKQDNDESNSVNLSSVVANGCNVTVSYSKNVATCVHLITIPGNQITHAQNLFCNNSGPVTVPTSSFNNLFQVGTQVKLCNSNNYSDCSSPVTITGNTQCVTPQCQDGIDNDGDGATDYPNDFSCSSPTDTDETNPKAACQDGIDNDGDGLRDFPQDPGCASTQDNDEFNASLPACQDGIDNDGDGRIDLQDPGCSGPTDTNEGDEAQCQDLRDNDGDGLTDFPFDPGCISPTDNDEFNQAQTVDVQLTKTGPSSVVRGQTLVYTIQVGNAGNAQATNVTVTDQIPAGVTFNDNASYSPCQQQGNQVSCSIGTLPAGVYGSFQIAFDVPTVPNCVQGQTPPIVNTATITATEDNATTGNNASTTANNPARVDCPAVPQCNDGIDNDNDGAADYPNDFSCSSSTDTDETNPKAACQDGFDNDFDGLVDFPQDTGCASKQDNDESNAPLPACQDGIDNDGDGRIDLQDPGCSGPTDTNEGDGIADLGISLSGPQTVQGGTNATYIATIVNNGPDAVTTPASIRVAIPAGVTFSPTSSSPGCVQSGNAVVCSGITLGMTFPSSQAQRTISFTIPGNVIASRGSTLLDLALGIETAHAQAIGVCNTTIVVTATIPQNANPDPNQSNNNATVSTFVSCQQFQCSDGIDNDGDGRADFPQDPGCSSAQDNNEGDEAACQDRRDNDGDGLVDWPLDPGCVSPTDTDEFNAPLPQCQDGIDNDGDGRIDMLDPGCSNPQDNNEGDDPACSDRRDNDGDGLVDWPLDPGCASPTDTDETNILPQCSDGIDNDFDGKVDMLDPGCSNPQDNNEGDDPVQFGCVEITKQTFDPHGTALPVTAQFTFILDATRVAYNDSTGRARFNNVLAGTHTVAEIIPSGWTQLSIAPANGLVTVVPGQNCAQITFRNRQVFVANAQCSDGYDNDGDGLVDWPQDTGCSNAQDNDEYNSTFVPQCRDGIDNDGDGLADYPQDPGCQNLDDNNEQNQSVTPACSDNLDNDGDGLKDYPADPGCANALDTDETNPVGTYACNDNVDNDGDGLKDYPADPGCVSVTDNDEFNFRVARCSDGLDNDGDGLIDYPQDTGCTTAYDDNEYNDRLWLDRWREWWNWNW